MELRTGENDKGRRLDRVLRKAFPDCPLPLIHRLLRKGQVLVNGKAAKAQDRVDSGVLIRILPKISHINSKPEKNDSKITHNRCERLNKPDIIWQTEGLIAVNKPCGLAVHGHESLDTMVRSYLADKIPPSLSFKSGPLHRLDKPSSGIVVFSASLEGARFFSSLMREHKVKKTYLAIVEGNVVKEEIWEDCLVRDKNLKKTFLAVEKKQERDKSPGKAAGKTAITKVIPIAAAMSEGRQYSLIKAQIATGRTHQIRTQTAAHGHPLAGDRKYGGSTFGGGNNSGFFLHSWKMEFLDTVIEAPLPAEFRKIAKELFSLKYESL